MPLHHLSSGSCNTEMNFLHLSSFCRSVNSWRVTPAHSPTLVPLFPLSKTFLQSILLPQALLWESLPMCWPSGPQYFSLASFILWFCLLLFIPPSSSPLPFILPLSTLSVSLFLCLSLYLPVSLFLSAPLHSSLSFSLSFAPYLPVFLPPLRSSVTAPLHDPITPSSGSSTSAPSASSQNLIITHLQTTFKWPWRFRKPIKLITVHCLAMTADKSKLCYRLIQPFITLWYNDSTATIGRLICLLLWLSDRLLK